MDSRKTLFLLMLVALGGGVVVWDHFRGVSTSERDDKRKRVLEIDAKAVTRVELVRSNQTIVLEKSAEHWDIKQPLAVRAEFSTVSALLDELEFAERTRLLSAKELTGVNLAEFGLTQPRLTIRLVTKTGTTVLQIGGETPAKDALYVKVEGQPAVAVVRKSSFPQSHQSLEQLRSRAVIEFEPARTTRLEIKAADRVIELTKSNVWVLARPLATRADQNKVSELLTELENLRIGNFISEKPEDVHTYHLDDPDREIAVAAGPAAQTLLIGKPLTNAPHQVYAKLKNADSIFTIATDSAKKFAVQINHLRDPRLLPLAPGAVQTIDIARGPDKISLQRSEPGWKITGPVALAGDDDLVRQFLSDLAGLRAKQFTADVATDLDKFGLATPELTLTLTGAGTLWVGALDASNGVRFVKRADEPFIYGIDPSALAFVPATYGGLRSRGIFNFPPEQITKLTVGAVTLSRDEQGKWKLIAPAQGILDVDAADAIAGLVAGLRAETFGRPKVAGDSANPVIQFTVGGREHWLANAADGQSAADNTELTFQLAPPVVATLTKKLVTEPKP